MPLLRAVRCGMLEPGGGMEIASLQVKCCPWSAVCNIVCWCRRQAPLHQAGGHCTGRAACREWTHVM